VPKYYNRTPVGINYTMRDQISDVNYCSWAMFEGYRSYNAND